MKSIMLLLAVLLSTALSQTIPASEAAKHIGERETVCGTIVGQYTAARSRGTPTFINLDQPYPHQAFTVVVWGNDKAAVGTVPVAGRFCVTGTIREYRGLPEVELRDAHSWYVPK